MIIFSFVVILELVHRKRFLLVFLEPLDWYLVQPRVTKTICQIILVKTMLFILGILFIDIIIVAFYKKLLRF